MLLNQFELVLFNLQHFKISTERKKYKVYSHLCLEDRFFFIGECLKKASKAAILLLLHLIIVSENEGKFGLFDGEA